MKRVDRIGFAAALLVSSALMNIPAVAQNASSQTEPRVTSETKNADPSQQTQAPRATQEDNAAQAPAASNDSASEMGDKGAAEAAPGQVEQTQAGHQPSNETTASIDISNEQKVEIRSVIQEIDVEPISVDFDVSVGVAVPRSIELRPLPPRIVEIVPAYDGFEYFLLADGRIIIVEPATLEVVYIIVA